MGKRNDTIAIIAVSAVALALVGSAMYAVSGMIGNGSDKKTEAINSVSNADKKDAINQSTGKADKEQPDKESAASDKVTQKNADVGNEATGVTEFLSDPDEVYEKFIKTSADDTMSYSNNYTMHQIQVEENGDMTLTKSDGIYTFKPPVDSTLYDSLEVDFYSYDYGICLVNTDGAAGSTYYDVYVTNDGGSKWKKVTTQAIAGHVSKIFMVGENDAYIISTGSAYMTDVVYYTHDGGNEWSLAEDFDMSVENGIIYPLLISDEENVVAIIPSNSDKEEELSMTVIKADRDWSTRESFSTI